MCITLQLLIIKNKKRFSALHTQHTQNTHGRIIWKRLTFCRGTCPTWALAYIAHTYTHKPGTGGTGWSTPGEMSENGTKKEIQSFLSDGAALPRETEMRTRRFAHSTRLHTQTRTKKNPFVTRCQAKPARRKNRAGLKSQHVFMCGCRVPPRMRYRHSFGCECHSKSSNVKEISCLDFSKNLCCDCFMLS